MATVETVLSALHERARVSITNQKLFDILNQDVKEDIRNDLYSSFSTDFQRDLLINIVSIGVPDVALVSPTVAGNVDNGNYRYKITFVTPKEEKFGGRVSQVVTVVDNSTNGQISLTNIPVGDENTTARKIYRAQNGTDAYFLIDTISDNTTTVFTDNVSQTVASTQGNMPIGVSLPSDYYDAIGLVDDSGREIRYEKPVEQRQGSRTDHKRRYWIESSQISFDPENPFGGQNLTLRYTLDIDDVSSTTDELPYPTLLQGRLLNVLKKGVAYYFLREKDAARYVQYLEAEYITAKEQLFQGGVVRAL